jgi:hypothetical protein
MRIRRAAPRATARRRDLGTSGEVRSRFGQLER